MSARETRRKRVPKRTPKKIVDGVRGQPTTQQRQQPQRNVQNAVSRAENRIKKIKSPFARDQTKTISNRPNLSKKRKLGQIPLVDRRAKQKQFEARQKKNELARQAKAFANRSQKSQGVQKASATAKPKVRKAFQQRNKSQDEINKIFDFSNNRRRFI